MLCLCSAQVKFLFQTDLGRENSVSCYRQGRQLLSCEYQVYISLQIFFLTANRKNTFQIIFSCNSGCKRSFERFSCLEFVFFEKSKHREAGLKHKLQL